MKTLIRNAVAQIGWRLPAQPGVARRGPVPLIYHGVPNAPDALGLCREIFERQLLFLREHFEFVTPAAIMNAPPEPDRMQVLLTFDDGFRNNAEIVAPVLRRFSVPAVFFVCTRHLVPGHWLWFTYLRALEEHYADSRLSFRGECLDMSRGARRDSVRRLRARLLDLDPHPSAMYSAIAGELPPMEDFTSARVRRDRYDGMSRQQVAELAADPLFTIGAHTADHPLLTRCSGEARRNQIESGRRELEKITGRTCELFAYPCDDHDATIRGLLPRLAVRAAFTVHRTDNDQPHLAIPRVGVYYPGLPELGFKIQWNALLRQLQQWKLIITN